MLAAAAVGALAAQLAQLQAVKEDWFARARIVDNQDVSLAADGAVTVRRQRFDKALRNFPKMDSPGKAKKDRKNEATDYDRCLSRKHRPPRSERRKNNSLNQPHTTDSRSLLRGRHRAARKRGSLRCKKRDARRWGPRIRSARIRTSLRD